MATVTPNYLWVVPTSSDLVKDGAVAIETLGDSADASLWNSGYGQAGKNKVINGDFSVNQRSFSSTTTTGTYGFDRFFLSATDGTSTYSAQTFTLGTAPVAGYEGKNFARLASTGQTLSTATTLLVQRIESVRTFANQTATLSFWAKAAAGTPKVALEITQRFGTGGSPSANVNTYGGQVTLSTSWARYSVTFTVPSISGKTLGTANDDAVALNLWTSAGTDSNSRTGSLGIQTATIDFWGVQFEYGSKATPFQTASGGSQQAELAMCQRYYFRNVNGASTGVFAGGGVAYSTTAGIVPVVMPVPMRITPTTLDTTGTASNYRLYNGSINSALNAVPTIGAGDSTQNLVMLNVAIASGLLAGSNFQLSANTSTGAYLGFGAEL